MPLEERNAKSAKDAKTWWKIIRWKRFFLSIWQLLTYLKLSGLSLGLIINWNVIFLRDGLRRVVRNYPEELTGGWIDKSAESWQIHSWRFSLPAAEPQPPS